MQLLRDVSETCNVMSQNGSYFPRLRNCVNFCLRGQRLSLGAAKHSEEPTFLGRNHIGN